MTIPVEPGREPMPMPPAPPGSPVREPEPDRLPDEEPNPNPDESDAPPQQVHAVESEHPPSWGLLCHGVTVHPSP